MVFLSSPPPTPKPPAKIKKHSLALQSEGSPPALLMVFRIRLRVPLDLFGALTAVSHGRLSSAWFLAAGLPLTLYLPSFSLDLAAPRLLTGLRASSHVPSLTDEGLSAKKGDGSLWVQHKHIGTGRSSHSAKRGPACGPAPASAFPPPSGKGNPTRSRGSLRQGRVLSERRAGNRGEGP